jgi:hypothetical protein
VLSRRVNLIKSSRAISRGRCTEYGHHPGTLMMMTEMDIETSVYYVHLTRLIAREDFIKLLTRVVFDLIAVSYGIGCGRMASVCSTSQFVYLFNSVLLG